MATNHKKTERKLTPPEIKTLISQGCTAESWEDVEVGEGFTCHNIHNVRFGLNVRIGAYNSTIRDAFGVERVCGIRNAHILNSSVGDNSLIESISGYIANYNIANGVIVEGCGRIVCSERSSFGNGVEVSTINEAGGREVPIYRGMTAQVGYMVAMYRHRPKMVEQITKLIESQTATLASTRGTIMSGARVSNCGSITNTYIETNGVVDGADSLSNGWVGRGAYIGSGVCAEEFIMGRGARVDQGANIKRCLVGEQSSITTGFMAQDSLLFSNCQLAGGEAVSIFAAPFTVSHHRSSLLVAGYFSFFNAGSGSNQSNHLFKTGAVHQGIHERGSKFASNAYIMLPAREGAFTMVLGRHTSHHDTQLLPYSYLIEQDGKSYLLPGANLQSYGTERDIAKWPQRDIRLGKVGDMGVDRVHFDEYNPYIGERLTKAISLCEQMLAKEGVEVHSYLGVRIKKSMVERGLKLYRLALDALVGAILETGGEALTNSSDEWVDMAGMFAPKIDVEALIKAVEGGEFDSIVSLERALDDIFNSYKKHSFGWALGQLGRGGTEANRAKAIERGEQARATLSRVRAEDALRDSGDMMRVSYGIDAGEDSQQLIDDFRQVRRRQDR